MVVTVKTEMTGPLFTNPNPIVRRVAEQYVERVMQLGEQRLDQTLRPRGSGIGVYKGAFFGRGGQGSLPPSQRSTGNYRRNIEGVKKGLTAVIHDSGVKYGPWLESGKSRRPTRFKGYHAFEMVGEWMEKEAKKEGKRFLHLMHRKLGGT